MSSAAADPTQPLDQRVLARVAELTRDLDPGALTVGAVERGTVSLGLVVTHSANFDVQTGQSKGPLPDGVERLNSLDELRATLIERLRLVNTEAGQLIDTWVATEAADYRTFLTAADCLRSRPAVGVQVVCGTCEGSGDVTCPDCSGHRRVTCPSCGGRGNVNCSQCGGTHQVSCFACHGSGSYEKRSFELNYDEAQKTQNQREMVVRVPCSSCGGSGKSACSSCFNGTVTCSGCGGGGQVDCPRCRASGRVPCDACGATGALYHAGRIQCTVHRAHQIDVHTVIDEDRQTFTERVPLDGLASMGEVKLDHAERSGHAVTQQYSARVPVEWVSASTRAETVSIRAYGPSGTVFDHHDLAGKLLEPDLARLEGSLAEHSVLKRTPADGLIDSTRRFVASELHAWVAEDRPKIARGSTAAALSERLAGATSVNLVGVPHLQRAADALARAVPHLCGSLLLSRALWFYLVTALEMFAARLMRRGGWSAVPWDLIVAGWSLVVWVAIELEARAKLKQMLTPELFQRLKAPLARAPWPYRWVAAIVLLLAWIAPSLLNVW